MMEMAAAMNASVQGWYDRPGASDDELSELFNANAVKVSDIAKADDDTADDFVTALFQTSWRVDNHVNPEANKTQKLDMYMERLKASGFKFSLCGYDIMGQRWKRYIGDKNNVAVHTAYMAKTEEEKEQFRKEFAITRYETWDSQRTESRQDETL